MATREKDLLIKNWAGEKNKFKVYTDLIWWEIENLEGVTEVSNLYKESDGYFIVTIDKRYNINVVLSEIKALANPPRQLNKQNQANYYSQVFGSS